MLSPLLRRYTLNSAWLYNARIFIALCGSTALPWWLGDVKLTIPLTLGVVAGALADLAVGLSIAWRPSARRGLWAAIALSAFYIVTGTLLLPELWNEPLGPLLKIWPILMAHFVALAILDER